MWERVKEENEKREYEGVYVRGDACEGTCVGKRVFM